jgi:hypothetical protein
MWKDVEMILTWESRSITKKMLSSGTFSTEDSNPTGFKLNLGLNNEKPLQIIKLLNLDGRREYYILIAKQICKFEK